MSSNAETSNNRELPSGTSEDSSPNESLDTNLPSYSASDTDATNAVVSVMDDARSESMYIHSTIKLF